MSKTGYIKRIIFDVDGTLIDFEENPRHEIIDLLRSFYSLGNKIYVHSGGGTDYAKQWVRKLGLTKYVSGAFCKARITESYIPQYEIAFDDEVVKYGRANIRV